MNAKAQILLVEDDTSLARVIRDYLALSQFAVTVCEDGVAALSTFKTRPFDLCIVDVMLPKMDGFTLVEKIRESNKTTPVLFLTSKSAKEDRIKGFTKGGDDFITKPFDIEELVLRINVFLKRSGKNTDQEVFEFGQCTFDYPNYELTVKANKQKLTEKEAEILRVLCSNRQRVMPREEMLMQVWGKDDYFLGRSMDVYISKLRKYLSPDDSVEIENHHGVGFKLLEKK
ncbi:MAG: response regulator transcription factor [Chitinophagales bacterium]|nr:response regulator transcription factor [Bacteroidota bacterium]MBX7140570.1 response regulator transcription factor [Chitinophagales bacterium]